jgi:TonB family protein
MALNFAEAGRRIALAPSMQCAWPTKRTNRNVLLTVVSLAGFGGILSWCVVNSPSRVAPRRPPLDQVERTLHRVPAHISEFAPVSEPLALPKCGNVRAPEALLTPDPPLQPQDDDLPVRVSFIVGADGHVHSAFILDSGGPGEDQVVLRAVRSWRYRPAFCNGVPTDSEALVRFSIR